MAVGNMPAVAEEMVEPDLKRVVFAPTPKMSTYLFVLTVGELERITADVDGVTSEIGRERGQRAGLVLEKRGELCLNPHHHPSPVPELPGARVLCKAGAALPRSGGTATGGLVFSRCRGAYHGPGRHRGFVREGG